MLNSKKIFNHWTLVKPVLFTVAVLLLQWLLGTHIRIPSGGDTGEWNRIALLDKYLKQQVEVLYFGDSTNWYSPKGETDRRSVSKMLKQMLPRYKIGSVAHAAFQMDVYAAYCQYIVRLAKCPKIIIIPVNMRSFSPQWDLEPLYQFEKEKAFLEGGLRRAFYTPLRVFQYKFSEISREQYLDTPVFKGDAKIGTLRKMRGMKKQLILRYLYPLTPEHRKLASLRRIAGLLSRRGIKAIFYITPIDHETGEAYLPGEFERYLARNTRFIHEQLMGSSHRLLDLSQDLSAAHFAWKSKGGPNEHLNRDGRQYVAAMLAKELSKLKSASLF